MTNEELGRRIKDLRKSRGLTQGDLSELLGISRGQISNLEHGRRGLDLPKLQKLCSALKVNLDYFGLEPNAEKTLDLLDRAKLLFESDKVPEQSKEELYIQLMKMCLKFKGAI